LVLCTLDSCNTDSTDKYSIFALVIIFYGQRYLLGNGVCLFVCFSL
jgi:hypothetical protein